MECGRTEEDVDNMVSRALIGREERVLLLGRQVKDSDSFPLIGLGLGFLAKLI